MNINNTFKGCCDEDEDEDGNDSLDLMCWGSDSNKPRPPTEKQALHKTALGVGSMAKILYNVSFIINIQSFDMIKFKYSHHDLQYGKQALHKIALDRMAMFFVYISYIDNDHQNQNEPLLSSYVLHYVIMIYNIFHEHHCLIPSSFRIQFLKVTANLCAKVGKQI